HTHAVCAYTSIYSSHIPTSGLYPLSLHDALPIWYLSQSLRQSARQMPAESAGNYRSILKKDRNFCDGGTYERGMSDLQSTTGIRSEEHTSELQSRFDVVCRLLLEKINSPHALSNL